MIVVPDAGSLKLLAATLGSSETVDVTFVLKLFSNNFTPNNTTLTSDFTEASFTGYAPVLFARSDWQRPALVSGKAGMLLFTAPSKFNNTGPSATVYGWYVVGLTTGVTLFCERFATPEVILPFQTLNLRIQFFGQQAP
jgi:hypothetical protein